jgi:hypothetical protein
MRRSIAGGPMGGVFAHLSLTFLGIGKAARGRGWAVGLERRGHEFFSTR